MILLHLLKGIFTSIISVLSLGASKILVIKTSIKQNLRDIMKISFVAVIAEVILSCYALNYNILEKIFSLTNNDLKFLLLLSC